MTFINRRPEMSTQPSSSNTNATNANGSKRGRDDISSSSSINDADKRARSSSSSSEEKKDEEAVDPEIAERRARIRAWQEKQRRDTSGALGAAAAPSSSSVPVAVAAGIASSVSSATGVKMSGSAASMSLGGDGSDEKVEKKDGDNDINDGVMDENGDSNAAERAERKAARLIRREHAEESAGDDDIVPIAPIDTIAEREKDAVMESLRRKKAADDAAADALRPSGLLAKKKAPGGFSFAGLTKKEPLVASSSSASAKSLEQRKADDKVRELEDRKKEELKKKMAAIKAANALGAVAVVKKEEKVEIDPLDAYMSDLSGSMTPAEKAALDGQRDQEKEAEAAEVAREAAEQKRAEAAAKAAATALARVFARQYREEQATATGTSVKSEQKAESVPEGAAPSDDRVIVQDVGPRISFKLPDAPTRSDEKTRYFGDEESVGEGEITTKEQRKWIDGQKKKTKELKKTDHSKIEYSDFKKNFYIPAKEISQMTEAEVTAYRETQLEGVKIRGNGCPNPVKKWVQCGLPSKLYDIITREKYSAPFPIQAQAIPVIMSGRDCIGCAKTGSGKTLAFVLPMIRHIMHQPALEIGEGPIGLILAPTRELATQIASETKKFAKPVGLKVVPIFGGAGIGEQIAMLKSGAEIIVATPGRLIDILCANSGRVCSLTRCTYVVLDEADRMFDMGFEPQIMRVIENIRPDRQTVMFSATFPKAVEALAKKALTKPIEIIIGGRSVASASVTQIVEVRPRDTKFGRLLEILGKWYTQGNILIFVDKQDSVDNLYRQLTDAGYDCASLHGGISQDDRESTLLDFKTKVRTLLVATSVIARGLDVKDLVLVINYEVPTHYEDYVHRVGRTGRAGATGTAITFIEPEEEKFSPDLVKALKASKQTIPKDLKKMEESFKEKVRKGEVKYYSNDGYGKSKGYKFDQIEQAIHDGAEQANRLGFLLTGPEAAEMGLTNDDAKKSLPNATPGSAASAAATAAMTPIQRQLAAAKAAALTAARALAEATAKSNPSPSANIHPDQKTNEQKDAEKAQASSNATAKAFAVALSIKQELVKNQAQMPIAPGVSSMVRPVVPAAGATLGPNGEVEEHHVEEIEINDYPQHARWKVTHKSSLSEILEMCDVAITTKGIHVPPGKKPSPGERPIYLVVEGSSRMDVYRAREEIVRILEEAAENSKVDTDLVSQRYAILGPDEQQ